MNEISVSQHTLDINAPVAQQIERCVAAGIKWMSLARHGIPDGDVREFRHQLDAAGIRVSSFYAAGYFLSEPGLADAVDNTRRMIDQAVELGTDLLYVVSGPLLDRSFETAHGIICDGLALVEEHACEAGVTLALEPVHPILAEHSCLHTLADALHIVRQFDTVRVIVDVYHLWWDVNFLSALSESRNRIAQVQVSDYAFGRCADRVPLGEGVIPLKRLVNAIQDTGFNGIYDIEIIGPCVKKRADSIAKESRAVMEALLVG